MAGAAPVDTAPQRKLELESLVRRIGEISTLPEVALRVVEVARDPDATATQLKEIVESDPALSARVLRMVNSAAYGCARAITNLQQAISYLGFDQIRNLALTASVSELFRNDVAIGPYRRRGLWRHMISVGVCARLVALRCGHDDFEDAFLAGLLHDIGIILLDQHAHGHFEAAMQRLEPGRSLIEIENEVIGVNHCLLASEIARQWRFPPMMRAAIRHHHASQHYHGEGTNAVRSVEIANCICTIKGISSVGVNLVKPPLEVFQTFGFAREDVVVLATDLDGELERNARLFEF